MRHIGEGAVVLDPTSPYFILANRVPQQASDLMAELQATAEALAWLKIVTTVYKISLPERLFINMTGKT